MWGRDCPPQRRRVGALARALGQNGSNPALGVWEKQNMRNRDDNSQCDRDTKTRPPGHEGKRTLEEFWRYQLDRVKERSESQALNPDSSGNI